MANRKVADREMIEFEDALLRSMGQAKRGEFAAVHTPEQIATRRGRLAGSETVFLSQRMRSGST